MERSPFSDDLRRYLALLWHWAWLLVLATLLAGGAAYLVSSRMTPIFQASTTILVNEAPATRSADYASVLTSQLLTQTFSQMITKQPVLEGVIQRVGLNVTVERLRGAIQVQPVKDTQLIEIKVESTDPSQAAAIANAVVAVFSEQNQALQASRYAASKQSLQDQLDQMNQKIQANADSIKALGTDPANQAERDRLEANQAQYQQVYASLLQSYESVRLAEAQTTSNIVAAEPATPPRYPIRPRILMNTALAAAVGLLLAMGLIFLIEALDDTLRDPDDVARYLGVPVLGLIAAHDTNKYSQPISSAQPRSPVSEAFRSLRTNIQFASVDRPIHTLLVTSPTPQDGKSTVSANLSVILAQSGHKVALVEGDLRRPRVHKSVGLPNRSGISELFVQPRIVLNGALQETEIAGLYAMTSGPLPPNPAELLGSEKMFDILRQVRERVDLVVVDSPPVMAVTDAMVLAPRMDGVLLVVRPGKTKLLACKQSVEQLQRIGANLLGVVLNDVELKRSSYKYASYKGYYYTDPKYYGKEDKKEKKVKVARGNSTD
ncbi:MAG TPA: polysaccharide biosynthesis tyrosine autokinase [Anaerolineales bacterium]